MLADFEAISFLIVNKANSIDYFAFNRASHAQLDSLHSIPPSREHLNQLFRFYHGTNPLQRGILGMIFFT